MHDAQNLANISRSVTHFLSKTVRRLGQETKFVQRTSKLTAELFVQTLITGHLAHDKMSLEDLCSQLSSQGVSITKQSLHERFNERSTALLESLFRESLQAFKREQFVVLDLLKRFS